MFSLSSFSIRVIGVGWTSVLTFAAMLLGVILAVTMAIMRMGTNPILRGVAWAYIWFRGTPVYPVSVLGPDRCALPRISLGIPFGPGFSFRTEDVITAGVAAVLGLGLNEGAYLSDYLSGLQSVDGGQWGCDGARDAAPSGVAAHHHPGRCE